MDRHWPRASSALVTAAVVVGGSVSLVSLGIGVLVAGVLLGWAVILGVGFER